MLLNGLCEELRYGVGCGHKAAVQVSLDFQRALSFPLLGHALYSAARVLAGDLTASGFLGGAHRRQYRDTPQIFATNSNLTFSFCSFSVARAREVLSLPPARTF